MTRRLNYKAYLFLTILSLTMIYSCGSFSALKHQNKLLSSAEIAAIVNEEMISITDLKNRVKLFALLSGQPYSESFYEQIAPQLLEVMINESLQRQQADFYKITIGTDEIKNAVTRLEEMNQKQEGFLKKLLENNHIPFEAMEKQIEASLAWDVISREMFRSSLQVSKNEVDSYIHRLESNRSRPHRHVAEIFIAVDNPVQEHKARQKANEIIKYLHQGANFSVLAQQFSDSPTKTQGGDIGWIPEGELEPVLSQTVSRLQPHEFSQPVRTQDGYVILYLIDAKDTSPEMAAQTVYTHKRINFPLSVTASESKVIEVFHKAISVSQNAKSCEMLVNLAKNAGANAEVKEVGGVKAQDLSPSDRGILDKLTPCKVGSTVQKCNASQPLRSEIGVLIFMVCKKDIIPAGEVNREEVENTIANQKLQKLMSREMRNLRRAAYIVNKISEPGDTPLVAQQ